MRSSWSILQKCVIGVTWLFLIIAVIFHIYSVVTVFDRNECLKCPNQETRIPWFVWYTSWCLWSTLATWIAWTVSSFCSLSSPSSNQCCSRSSNYSSNSSIGKSAQSILLGISTPWSVTVTISYTYYLITGDLGRDYVDQDLCFTISDSAIPRTTDRTSAIIFLVFDRIVNLTMHYGCAIINLFLMYNYSTNTTTTTTTTTSSNMEQDHGNHGQEKGNSMRLITRIITMAVVPISCFVLLSIIIGIIHTYVDQVYCTNNVWMDVSLSCTVFIVICCIRVFLEQRRRKRGNADDVVQSV